MRLIDDWIAHHSAQRYDKGGAIAASGSVHEVGADRDARPAVVRPRPRPNRSIAPISPAQAARGLSLADGAATLTAFTAETIRLALGHVPPLARLLVTGGGRHNSDADAR